MVFAHVLQNTDHNFLDGEFGGHDGVPFFCAVLYLYDMATAQPFAYNPSRLPISGTTQSGDFAVGIPVTGQSVTITFSQTGNTAIYSGDTNSFKQWIQAPTGSGFVFGANIGVPPSNTPSGAAVLVQSATTNYTIGSPVYVSLVIN